MRTNLGTRLIAVVGVLCCCFALPWGEAAGQPQGPRGKRLPFRCFADVWNGPFRVGAPVFDRAAAQISWALEAKQDTRARRYEAFLADPDGVEVATVAVTLDPNRPQFKAGSKLRAVVSLRAVAVENVSTVMIRERR